MPDLTHNLEAVHQRIASAAHAAGRDERSVELLAVSKTFPADDVRAVHAAGQRAFGENYVQEAINKIETLADLRASLEWHFIGPLQSNKTRPVAEHFDWVHSVDRLKIAQRLSEQRPDNLPPLNVCLQVNISGEASKSGVSIPEAVEVAQADRRAAETESARADVDSRTGRRHSTRNARRIVSCANCSSVCVTTGSNSTRCRWACRATSKRPCSKARRSCASAPRFSARETTPTDPGGPIRNP